jgi:hypothetical protein
MSGTPSLSWKWSSVGSVSTGDLGQPDSTTPYVLCVYDSGGSGSARLRALLPLATGWKLNRKGYQFKSKTGVPEGITKVKLNAGAPAKQLVKGKGTNLMNPGGALVAPVTTQLMRGDSAFCSEAVYSTPAVNDTSAFKAKSD